MAIKKKQASKPARPKGGKATKPVKKAAAKKPLLLRNLCLKLL
jgi:hypothetical protein